ncbi:MAG: HRDC domain-containing protein [Saccharospirillaceae bacterium]|nr:HRDC domain-containing protein [Pseudomonadales bacterium]NRB78651.1 HRDC domain-containing protein [Saccharospirillaceae bacterium]
MSNNQELSNNQNYEYITSQSELESKVALWETQDTIFLDTEFIRTQTFYPILALIQIKAAGITYVIDPKAIEDLSCLKPLLTNPKILKVLHALSEDVEVFSSALGIFVEPVLDTQLAAKWLNIGEGIGYAKLIEHGLQVVLAKDQTQSDWLQRPLTPSQKQYAADDVIYLEQIYKQLQAALIEKDRFDVVLEDSARLASNMKGKPHDQYYLKVKRAWKLQPKNQFILKQLCIWREQIAREDNVPRTRVFNDIALAQIAERLPQSKSQVSSLVDVHPKQIRKYAQLVADCINEQIVYLDDPTSTMVSKLQDLTLIEVPLSVKSQANVKKLKQQINLTAQALDVYPDCVCNKKQLEGFYRKYVLEKPSFIYDESYFSGYRQRFLQPVLLEFLNHE